jgi:isocitrate lyase
MMSNLEARALRDAWERDARWDGITRPYSPDEVLRLRGSLVIQHTLATMRAPALELE